jgi:hypothetical protein
VARVVHVVVGSSAEASFRQADIAADRRDVLTLADALSLGPLLPIVDTRSWIANRLAYWKALGVSGDPNEADDGLYADTLGLESSDEIVMWLGTELADQIAQAWLPAFLRALDVQAPALKVVQFEHGTRGREVLGLGFLHPKEIAAHAMPVALTKDDIVELDLVWNALTSSAPGDLTAYLGAGSSRFPLLTRALLESLGRYPDAGSGLNRWTARLLRNVPKSPRCALVIGQTLADGIEEFYAGAGGHDSVGDAWLFDRMVRLADPKLREPALEITGSRAEYHDSEVRLTPFGRRILDGLVNFVDVNGIDDWVFGVHLQSDEGRVWFHRDGELVRR